MRLRTAALAPLLLLVAQLVPEAEAAITPQERATAPAATRGAAPAGPDVSKYQHPGGRAIDWAAVRRSGQVFAFVKATGGSNRIDPWFEREWAAAGRAGMIRGAYHYADPSRSALAQADLVVNVVGTTREANDLGIVLDLESSGGLGPAALSRWAHTFLTRVERRTGRVPIIYTAPYFWRDKMGNNRSFGAYPLWLARYSSSAPGPLPGWDRWTFWQHTASHRLPGIPGAVDHNLMCCSHLTLRALADGRSVRITRLWKAMGGASGQLGLPVGMEASVPGGWAQSFERGYVATSWRGTFAVTGDTLARYQATGGPRGVLGMPVSAARTLASGVVEQRFVHGRIVGSAAAGAHVLRGDLEARWLHDGGASAPEGLPTSEADPVSQQFAHGGLYRTPHGVRLVPGAIRDRYQELGGPRGVYGLPVSEAYPVLGGQAVDFERTALYEIDVAGQKIVL